MCAAKEQRPTLQGTRYKTRKRDEKVKYDPKTFCEVIIATINEAGGDLEAISAALDKEGGKQDYNQYAEQLLDILIAGGMLQAGGIISEQVADVCVVSAEPTLEAIRGHIGILVGLLRRYRYLQKNVKDEMNKVLTYLKQFTESQRKSLAIFVALCISENLVTPGIIYELFSDHLVKDENVTLAFSTVLFSTWLNEKGIVNVGSALRKVHLEDKLLKLLPPPKRREHVFDEHFEKAGLTELVTFRKSQQNTRIKRKLKDELDEYIKDNAQISVILDHCQEYLDSTKTLTDVHITILLWRSVMGAVEWNKKEDLLGDQALRHLTMWCGLFEPYCERGTPQLTLLLQIQEFCYENMNFMKIFHKIVLLLYNHDILSEQAILKWYNDAHYAKGKSVFLPQMKKMVDWLLTAEEESDEEKELQ